MILDLRPTIIGILQYFYVKLNVGDCLLPETRSGEMAHKPENILSTLLWSASAVSSRNKKFYSFCLIVSDWLCLNRTLELGKCVGWLIFSSWRKSLRGKSLTWDPADWLVEPEGLEEREHQFLTRIVGTLWPQVLPSWVSFLTSTLTPCVLPLSELKGSSITRS